LKKALFIVFSVLLVASLVFIPTNTTTAKPDLTAQVSAPSPAQTADEEAIIKDILKELDAAKKMTNDKDIRKHIDVLKDWVKKLRDMIKRGDTQAALDIKLVIAERLEWLINQLPVSTAPPATFAAGPTAPPSPNPLYDELVRIRIKIDKLIELERAELGIRPLPTLEPIIPTVEQVPEARKLIVYSAKFLCGPAFGKEGVQPGSYSTAINVHNPHDQTVYLYKKAVIAKREYEPRGRISGFRRVVLRPDEAIEIDCIDIVGLFRGGRVPMAPPIRPSSTLPPLQPSTGATTPTTEPGQPGTGPTTPPQQPQDSFFDVTTEISIPAPADQPTPQNQPTVFAKGFVVIYATGSLDVVAVYTASTPVGFSLDVEYVKPTTRGDIRVPPEEEPECPYGCYCMTKEEAGKRNYTTLCEDKICGYDDRQNPRYCWKPGTQAQCPQGCVCLRKEDAYKRYGQNAQLCQDAPCGYDQSQNPLYCWKPTTTTQPECPQGCVCLSKDAATERYGNNAVTCTDQPCGYDQNKNPLFCWKPTTTTQIECPQGCVCLRKEDAYKRYGQNAQLCQDAPCDYSGQTPLFCWKPTITVTPIEPVCPQGCYCLSQSDAKNKGYTVVCSDQPCGNDQAGNSMYCFRPPATTTPTPTQIQCPQGCYCLSQSDAKNKGYTDVCSNQSCGSDQYNNPMYCFRPPATGATTAPLICPTGCTCITEAEARKKGYNTKCQDSPCGYDQYQNAKYCFRILLQVVPFKPTVK
jgi:hypothetical protein